MKILFIALLFSRIFTKEKECGYYGEKGIEVEKKLDECYAENVKESRVRMAIGFEVCFGFNYWKLNETVSGPLNEVLKEESEDIYRLAQTSCQLSQESKRPLKPNGDIDYEKERTLITNCKKFFDLVGSAFHDK